jgi:hypothetical protein
MRQSTLQNEEDAQMTLEPRISKISALRKNEDIELIVDN